MQTDLAKKLGIEFPIFAFTHCRDVVVAVSKAGGLGVLGAVGFTPEQLEVELNWIDEHIGDHVYGHNDNGWVCQDFATGAEVWMNKSVGKGAVNAHRLLLSPWRSSCPRCSVWR